MSRSYKKHMGGSYCGNSDKYSRSVYHRSKRQSDKKYCYELCKKYEIKQIFQGESNFCLKCMLYTEELYSGDLAYCQNQTIDDLPTDKIVSVVDYSCKYSDKWSWASDGGSFLMETESSLQCKFNSELFGLESNWRHKPQNIWQRYQSAIKNKQHYSYDFVDMIVSKNLAKRQFQTCEELVVWFKENQKWLIKVWKKLNYGK